MSVRLEVDHPFMSLRRPALALASLLTLSLAATACSGTSDEPGVTPKPKPSATAAPIELSLGVFGSKAELASWRGIVEDINAERTTTQVELDTYPTSEAVTAALAAGDIPDVFMVARDDLRTVMDEGWNSPVSELLDERGVDFGDRHSRDAMAAMSAASELQCMPWSISPQVVYLNDELVNFDEMREEGFETPYRWDRWTLNSFGDAAAFATRDKQRTAGVHVEPSVEGLAPFILSAGGEIFDDALEPTSLNFSSVATTAALEQVLGVLRDATVTLPQERLERRTAVEWFKAGRLGMFVGDRSHVPELRAVKGLSFNVMTVPRFDTNIVSTGEVNGLCISSKSKHAALAANLITDVVADEPVAAVVRHGRTQPVNLAVAGSEEFLQTDLQPGRSKVHTVSVRGMWFPPLQLDMEALDEAVGPLIHAMINDPGDLDLEAATAAIDEASRTVLSPEEVLDGDDEAGASADAQEGSTREGGAGSTNSSR